jgi:type II secretory pathway predicted ATPase ExeA
VEHLSTFGLERDPFSSDPQLLWYFEGKAFADATRRFTRAALQGKGLCLLSGRGGVGKTMLVRHLLETLDADAFEACMLVPQPGITDLRWLLVRFAQQLGVEEPAADLAALLAQVYEQLTIVREEGRRAVLILDEADVLAERGVLTDLRGLLNLEYEERRLLTLVLVGSPALAEAIAREVALADRLDLRVALPLLAPDEVAPYLHHRIRAAGGNPAILESSAFAALAKWGAGLPRRLNLLADTALYEAHTEGRVSATVADVERAALELGLEASEAPPASARALAPAPAAKPVSRHAPAVREKALTDSKSHSVDAIFDEPEEEFELGEVVAEPTHQRRVAAAETMAILSESEDDGELEFERPSRDAATVAFLGEQRPARGRKPEPVDEAADLEDLFANIVDE